MNVDPIRQQFRAADVIVHESIPMGRVVICGGAILVVGIQIRSLS